MGAVVEPDGRYSHAVTKFANPHAPTGYFNGTATTTYTYDAIGNMATTSGAATSTFMWDYRNRMIRAWVSGATSTYQYDHTVQRMRQVVAFKHDRLWARKKKRIAAQIDRGP